MRLDGPGQEGRTGELRAAGLRARGPRVCGDGPQGAGGDGGPGARAGVGADGPARGVCGADAAPGGGEDPDGGADAAERAFEALRAEVAELRGAVVALAERVGNASACGVPAKAHDLVAQQHGLQMRHDMNGVGQAGMGWPGVGEWLSVHRLQLG